MSTTSIILVKSRTYFPSKTKVMTMFYFRDPVVFFNIFFQNLFMNRVNEDTSLAFINARQHEYILNAWSSSPLSDNTIFDSKLPYPNTRNYVWSNASLNTKIGDVRQKELSTKKSGRPYLDTPIKKLIKDCLLLVNHYTIEITKKILDEVMLFSHVQFSYQFSLPKQMRSSKISETNYSKYRLQMNVVDSIKVFADTFMVIQPSCHLPKPTFTTNPDVEAPTTSSPDNKNIECVLFSDREEEDDDEAFKVHSRHPSYIKEDGSLVETSPVRRSKRQRIENRPPTPFSLLRTPTREFSFNGLNQPTFLCTPNTLERNRSLLFSPSFEPQAPIN